MGLSIYYTGCDNSDDSPAAPSALGLSATATTVILLTNDSGYVVISNGIEPYVITEPADGTVASAVLGGRVVAITSAALGTTAIKIKDSSIPAKTISITVTVVASYTTPTSGSLSFTSDRGNVSINGIGSLGNSPPTSGAGVIALGEFNGTLVYAYTVHSMTNIEIVTLFFQSKSVLTAGTYTFPSSDKSVEIIYRPNVDPADTLTMNRRYILATTATANVETLSSTSIKGTFSGTGYYDDNGTFVPSQTIAVSAGTFTVPVLMIGKRQESNMEKLIVGMFKQSR